MVSHLASQIVLVNTSPESPSTIVPLRTVIIGIPTHHCQDLSLGKPIAVSTLTHLLGDDAY